MIMIIFDLIIVVFYIFFIQATVNCDVANDELLNRPSVEVSKMKVIIKFF